ncbi:MAG: alpha-ketoglutarate-dependent dioxygenase AlkB [Paracoccaceae bacterium]|nr:alpha-ketoglutarate-dependent dioxygenase AlkB [Paracoccaceae bacterium]
MKESADPPPIRPVPQQIGGFVHYPGWLDAPEQAALRDDLRGVVAAAPLFAPVTPSGKAMSVRMTSAGRFGWVSDRRGYRYSETHPNGRPWPAIPARVLDIWQAVAGTDRSPDCCLINFYDDRAKMGLHQDRDEADFTQPVVSISLGDDALFRIGATTRGGPTQSLWLRSGDVLVMGGAARLRFHGIDRIARGTSLLLPNGGRLNLTLRVVT